MQQPNSYCSHCGSTVEAGSKFCESCGAPIAPAQPPQPGYFPPPSGAIPPPPAASSYPPAAGYPPAAAGPRPVYPPPPPPGMRPIPRPYQPPPKSSSPCLTILTIGCLAVICLVVVSIGAFFLLGDRIATILNEIESQLNPPINLPQIDALPTGLPPIVFQPTDIPVIDILPTAPPQVDPVYLPTATAEYSELDTNPQASGLTGQQELSDYLVVDDFSSNALGWEQSDSEISARDYEQDAYYIYVKKPEYLSWSIVPVSFTPYEVEFDAKGPMNLPGGSFGVLCQYQDDQNYYMVEIDLHSQDFSIAMVVNDERTPLLDPEWVTIYGLFTASDDRNHFSISCYPGWISLSVNGEMAGSAELYGNEPFSDPGDMALFVGTWENIGPDGYWIYFDNVSAWKPVQ